MSIDNSSPEQQPNQQPIQGPWRYIVAAAPMVGFLILVTLVFYLLG